ncbi:MAG: MFS transporter [Planctomycetota bacterium]|nr:MAG: MFS transporter [Planctomycetota bacterium]
MFSPNTLRLAVMMFLQFFVWGAWYVSMTGFINDQQMSAVTGAAYSVGPLAAIIAPFFLGMVADRFFATERVLSALHILGGLALFAAPSFAASFELQPPPENASLFYKLVLHDLPAYTHPFILALLVHMLCYMPTLGLSTSLAFHNLDDQEKQFPLVRVAGTIGWIVGNIAVSFLPAKDKSPEQFYLAGGAAILLGLYSLTLPHTPPPQKGKKPTLGQILGTDSLVLFRSTSYTVFIICSFLLCIPLAGYYAYARTYVESANVLINGSATFTMSLGQMSEVFFMLVMPLFFAFLGVKWMLAVGMAAWVLRYGLFAAAAGDQITWMIVLGVLLHGICYDFFFVTGMIYVDKKAHKEIRSQAQGFLVLVTQGLGLGLGAKLFAAHVMMHTTDQGIDWRTVWLYPAVFAGIVLVAFCALFWDRPEEATLAASKEAVPAEA